MSNLTPGTVYDIELCSGEHRCWRYVGPDARDQRWWRDQETGREFNETSVMYAWTIIGPVSGVSRPDA